MDLTLQPVLVATGEGGEGRLVFRHGVLVAVLVMLSSLHGEQAGWWFLEKGFGALDGVHNPSFPDLETATGWMQARLVDHPPTASSPERRSRP